MFDQYTKIINMKSLIILFAFLSPLLLSAQSDTAKIEQYCELIAQGRLFSTKVTIDIDFGEGRSYFNFKDTRVKDELSGKVKKFRSTVDALNYLGAMGWKLVNAFPALESGGSSSIYHFIFRKTFNRNELVENKNVD